MDIKVLKSEMSSGALQEVVASLVCVIGKVEAAAIPYQQASVEITAHKHVLQALALDWAFAKKIGSGVRKVEQVSATR